ncbi:MAG: carboxypeptidase regulatory-like domain-containing protein [Planctomycetes bacterium]|nr:carboxypeptidase regulatory-like domain-containing protein [Planctomycetota bacterium]
MVRFIARACGLLGVVLAAGCAGSGTAPVPVSGELKLDGKPLAGAVVTFQPQAPGGKAASGTVGADGTFRLTTDSPGDGAAPGKYKVVVQPPAEGGATPFDPPGKAATRPKSVGPKVPEKYTRPDQTPLTQEVPAPGPVVIDLQSR